MRARLLSSLSAATLTALAACAGAASAPQPSAAPRTGANAGVVLHAEQLQNTAGTLLAVLRSRLSGMRVRDSGGSCPEITLRGTHSLLGDNSPAIYVDGIRAANTCLLDMLGTADVVRVEVYPMGVAPRPPYKAHPHGLILVYLATGHR